MWIWGVLLTRSERERFEKERRRRRRRKGRRRRRRRRCGFRGVLLTRREI